MREQAVFALSQLKDGTDWLLEGPALEARHGDDPARAVLARAVGRSAGASGDREDPGEIMGTTPSPPLRDRAQPRGFSGAGRRAQQTTATSTVASIGLAK